MVAGVAKRAATATPPPDRKLLRQLRKFVRRWCRKHLAQLPADTDVSFETWLSNTNYTETRKQELRRKHQACTNIWDPKYHICKCFMKDETYPTYKHARGIYSRTDEFKCFVGPWFKAIEGVVYKHPAFIKHVAVLDRPQYIIDQLFRPGAVYMATDYTAFESLFVKELMYSCEFELYSYMTAHVPGSNDFMRACREVIAGGNVLQFRDFTAYI